MNITELETPCLILDKKKLKNNIKKFNQQIKNLGVKSRPHGKTAKNINILKMCLIDQTHGITVSTLKEAEYYFKNGIKDIIYAVGIAPVKLERVVFLIKSGCNLSVILDSLDQVKAIDKTASKYNLKIPVYIEIDSDGQRAGLSKNNRLLIDLGKAIYESKATELKGVLTHAGTSYHSTSIKEIKSVAEQERKNTVECANILKKNNLPCPVVSVGSTPTASLAENLDNVTEVRAGVYMFMDLVMAGIGVCSLEDIAISVIASVIGHQKDKNWVITDAGWMALSRDRGTATQNIDQGYGLVCDSEGHPLADYIVSATSQEHGIISSRNNSTMNWDQFPIGSMVRILPNHACATAAMFDQYHVIEGSSDVREVWSRINRW